MNNIKKTLSYRKFIYSLIFMLDNEISSYMTENIYKIILLIHSCETFRNFIFKFYP